MKLGERIKRWGGDESGGTTIEFLLWLPIMVTMLTMTTDATLLMHQQQNIYNVARDASRQVALGQKTDEEAAAIVVERLEAEEADVSIVIEDGFVTTNVSIPFSKHAKISGFFVDGDLSAAVSMWVENNES